MFFYNNKGNYFIYIYNCTFYKLGSFSGIRELFFEFFKLVFSHSVHGGILNKTDLLGGGVYLKCNGFKSIFLYIIPSLRKLVILRKNVLELKIVVALT